MTMILSPQSMLLTALVLLIYVSSMRSVLAEGEYILGNREGCTEEGEVVPKESIRINSQDLTCFTCLCKQKMAEIKDRKTSYYSNVQSVKDESNAPGYLETAGDVLIKDLARKQGATFTTLEEQLKITQDFEKGFELKPTYQKGISTLEEFKKNIPDGETSSSGNAKEEEDEEDIEELKQRTGLSRHELELGLSEKPNSETSKLYKFALRNKRKKEKNENKLESKLVDHPINHLKEIEEEFFGHLRSGNWKKSNEIEKGNEAEILNEVTKKRKHRKRRKKGGGEERSIHIRSSNAEEIAEDTIETNEVNLKSYRPSLWDVKDVKKLCNSKAQTCSSRTLYAVKDGKIVKLENTDDIKSEVSLNNKNFNNGDSQMRLPPTS